MAQSSSMNTFFNNLERALTALGLQWKDLSERSGVSASSISRLKAGTEDITFTRAERLAESIGYSLWEVVSPSFMPRLKKPKREKSSAA